MKKSTGSSINDQSIALTCVHRTTPRGPSAADMFHSLIADVRLPVLCIQCLWVRGAGGWGLEFTAFFKGVAIALPCCLAAFLVMVSAECCMAGCLAFWKFP